MILYIARHGQPALDGMTKGGDFEFPSGDFCLTALGRKQAEFLGKYLAGKKFCGKVVTSPYVRTVETASVVASVCGLDIYFDPDLQEMRFYPEPSSPGLTLEELRKCFPNVAADASLKYPWMTPGGTEEYPAVKNRISGWLDRFVACVPEHDVLLVGHGASVTALKEELISRSGFEGDAGYNWNCSCSSFEISQEGKIKVLDLARFDFIPLEYVTSNKRVYGDPACV